MKINGIYWICVYQAKVDRGTIWIQNADQIKIISKDGTVCNWKKIKEQERLIEICNEVSDMRRQKEDLRIEIKSANEVSYHFIFGVFFDSIQTIDM